MKSDYTQVSCATHSQLELMIMHAETLQLTINTGMGQETMLLKPYDLVIRRDKGEYLLGRGMDEKSYSIRLDQIITFYSA